jgi:hypothetical protein
VKIYEDLLTYKTNLVVFFSIFINIFTVPANSTKIRNLKDF